MSVPSLETEKQPPLKGPCASHWLRPTHREGASREGLQAGPNLHRGPRPARSPSASKQTRKLPLSIGTHRPGWGLREGELRIQGHTAPGGMRPGRDPGVRAHNRPPFLNPGQGGARRAQGPGQSPSIHSPAPMCSCRPCPQGHCPTLKMLTTETATREPHSKVHVPNINGCHFQPPLCPPPPRHGPPGPRPRGPLPEPSTRKAGGHRGGGGPAPSKQQLHVAQEGAVGSPEPRSPRGRGAGRAGPTRGAGQGLQGHLFLPWNRPPGRSGTAPQALLPFERPGPEDRPRVPEPRAPLRDSSLENEPGSEHDSEPDVSSSRPTNLVELPKYARHTRVCQRPWFPGRHASVPGRGA